MIKHPVIEEFLEEFVPTDCRDQASKEIYEIVELASQ